MISRDRRSTAGAPAAYAVTRAHHADVGRHGAGQHARRLARAAAGGPRDPAGAPRRAAASRCATCSTCCWPTPARRASARATCAPSSPPTGWPSAAWPRWPSATAPERVRGGVRRPARLRRAAHPRRHRRDARRPLRGRRRPSRATASTEGDLWIRVAVTIAGERDDGRLHRHRPDRARATATARPPSPARPSTSWCAASPTRTSRPRRAPSRRSTVVAPGGHAGQRDARRPPWRAATSRPRAASSTRSSRRSATRSRCRPRARAR